MWNKYLIATNIEEATRTLSDHPNESKLIAGGTDLVLEMEKGAHHSRNFLIDISRIKDLDFIQQDEDKKIHIGAMVTHNQVLGSKLLRQQAMCLAEACYQVGSPQIRNRATVVGNLVTASPANDTIPALMALDASLVIVFSQGERLVKLRDFYTGVRKTVLNPDELVKEIIFEPAENSGSAFFKLALRNAQAISLVNAAVWLKSKLGIIEDIRIAVGAAAPTVVRLRSLETFLKGKKITESITTDIWPVLIETTPISDIRSSQAYRSEMVKEVVLRCLERILEGNTYKLPVNPSTLEGKLDQDELSRAEAALIDYEHPILTTINGIEFQFTGCDKKTLLELLREDAKLTGTKEGCDEGECGACTVYLDGKAVMACLVPSPRAHLAKITTIEGISPLESLHPVQQSFIDEGAVQCGYCTPGFVMSAAKLLEENPKPSIDEIKEAITGNLCRCTGYYKIVKAIEKASNQ